MYFLYETSSSRSFLGNYSCYRAVHLCHASDAAIRLLKY
jgi:hypothetical protein